MPDPSTDAALAHHHVGNLLYGYTDVADRKDVDAGVALLGHATVRFPTDGFDRPRGRTAASSSGCGATTCRTATT